MNWEGWIEDGGIDEGGAVRGRKIVETLYKRTQNIDLVGT